MNELCTNISPPRMVVMLSTAFYPGQEESNGLLIVFAGSASGHKLVNLPRKVRWPSSVVLTTNRVRQYRIPSQRVFKSPRLAPLGLIRCTHEQEASYVFGRPTTSLSWGASLLRQARWILDLLLSLSRLGQALSTADRSGL